MSDQLVSVKAPDAYYYAGQLQRVSGWVGASVKIREAIERHAADLTDAGVVFDDVETNGAP